MTKVEFCSVFVYFQLDESDYDDIIDKGIEKFTNEFEYCTKAIKSNKQELVKLLKENIKYNTSEGFEIEYDISNNSVYNIEDSFYDYINEDFTNKCAKEMREKLNMYVEDGFIEFIEKDELDQYDLDENNLDENNKHDIYLNNDENILVIVNREDLAWLGPKIVSDTINKVLTGN